MAEATAVTSTVLLLNNSESSSESDFSFDEELERLQERRKRVIRPRIANYTELIVSRYTDDEFKSHFRLHRTTFEYILNIISNALTRQTKGYETIPPRKQFMIALWKMGITDSYRPICDRFNVGRATALRAVRRVTRALFTLAPQYISWPSGDEAELTMRKFVENSGFPRTVGAIDGTHIKIEAPTENSADYVNRKGFHSIQLQVLCNVVDGVLIVDIPVDEANATGLHQAFLAKITSIICS